MNCNKILIFSYIIYINQTSKRIILNMDNIIDVHKTIYSPIGRFIVSRMASSVYWSNDHTVNEYKKQL